jgi:hypothetical protein
VNTKLYSLVGGEVGTPEFQAVINELIAIAQRTGHVKVHGPGHAAERRWI